MNGEQHRGMTARIAKYAVGRLAPEELDLFEETSEVFFAAPRAVHAGLRRKEPLGMGVETVVSVISGVALAVASDVLTAAMLRGVNTVGDGMRPRLRRWFRRGGAGAAQGPVPASIPPLGPEQQAALRSVAEKRARTLGLAPEQAELLANAIVGGLLALTEPRTGPEGTAPDVVSAPEREGRSPSRPDRGVPGAEPGSTESAAG